jgi:error-prone DNA polymerase
MSLRERIDADFRTTGLTAGRHPMALLRPHHPDLWTAAELKTVRNNTRIRTGGAVICRQRPGTAHGTLFLSLEDETGVSNVVVSAAMFERHRLRIIEEPCLIIEGIAQIHETVLHIRALAIEPLLTRELPVGPSHDFR